MDKEFRLFPFGLAARLVLAGGLYAAGAFIQLVLPAASWLGLLVSASGWLPLLLKPATNKPDDQGLEEWRLVSMAEFDRLEDSLRETKKLRRKVRSPAAILLLVFGLPLFAIVTLAGWAMDRADLLFVALNAGVCLVPPVFFGRVSVFEPKDIVLKMPCFRALLAAERPDGLTVAPYFRFDKDEKGQDVPEDLRFLVEPKRGPEDLVGVQLQAAINNGPNGAVPYLYAVVLTRGRKGAAHAAASRIRARGFEVEPGGDDDFGTVVIRQETSDGGYHTTPDDCATLAGLCYSFLSKVSKAEAQG